MKEKIPFSKNDYTITGFRRDDKSRKFYFYTCKCGETGEIRSDRLKQSKCICRHNKIEYGTKFARLTILEKDEENSNKGLGVFYWCLCDCGNKISRNAAQIKRGHIKSCGCLHEILAAKLHEYVTDYPHNYEDISGNKYGRLTPIKYNINTGKWLCLCDCGNKKEVKSSSLKLGRTVSCGCYGHEMRIQNKKKNTYDLTGDYGIGYDENGNKFLFDLEDYEKIKDYYWTKNKHGYIESSINNRKTLLSRLVMGVTEYDFKTNLVDHIHGKETRYDNRKSNLRIATSKQNNRNRGLSSRNTSGVTGVVFERQRNKWRANIMHLFLGRFDTKEEAIAARKAAEEKYYGEYSYDNSQELNRE